MQATTTLIQSIPADPRTGASSVPIYQTSPFVQDAPGMNKGFDYARIGNPTRQALENMPPKSIPAEKRKAAGISDRLIRLSVRPEEHEDLMEDREQAFAGIKANTRIRHTAALTN